MTFDPRSDGNLPVAAMVEKFYGGEAAQKLCDFIEHRRTKDPSDDPFAAMNGCEDVLPQS